MKKSVVLCYDRVKYVYVTSVTKYLNKAKVEIMIRIICAKCKNAYLQNKDNNLVCPSCGVSHSQSKENLLLGVQYYKEGDYSEADNCFMKYIVKSGTEPLAIFYKAFCDALDFDEDTLSLSDTYQKIINAFSDASDEDFPKLVALANDEIEKIEKSLTEVHIRLFADADAEKIKKQVETILNIQKEARNFRTALTDLVAAFNERSERKISAKFSDCFFVDGTIAAEVGEIKYQRICDNIASHTVFTGILTNDIKNLEIYLRCIVMFFQKSHDKYEFLLEQSNKFVKLAEILELGQYNTIKGTASVADKLKTVSYDFLQESYKEHFDEQINIQTETVVIIEPEIIEIPKEAEIIEATTEDVVEEGAEEITEETEDVNSADESDTKEETEAVVEVVSEDVETVQIEESEVSETVDEIEIPEDDVIEIEVEEASESTQTELIDISSTTEIDEIITDDEESQEAIEATVEETTETESEDDAVVEIPSEANESEEIIEETIVE